MKTFFISILLITAGALHVRAQAPEIPFSVNVTAILSDDENEQLERHILERFERHLRARGVPQEGTSRINLLIDATAIGEQVVLSVTKMLALPEGVIELGAAEEAFFMHLDAETLPEEGRDVRQHVSREWLSQFHSVLDQKLLVFPSEQLDDEIQRIVADITGSSHRK